MATTITPNMGLIVPGVGTEPGPNWAQEQNADLSILDQHDHSLGQGVPVTPAGLNINTDLPLNSNNLISAKTVRFTPLITSLPGVSPNLGAIYVAGNELYYNDELGNVIAITKTGSVNAGAGSITGLPSGTASASYSPGSQTFVWQSATLTPANMDGGSFIFRNISASSHGVTVNPPVALAADYSLTLPPTNTTGGTTFLTIDTSNNMGEGPSVTGGLSDTNITPGGIGTVSLTNGSVTLQKIATPNIVVSSSCGAFAVAPGSAVLVTNLTCTITTSGKPVSIVFQSDGSGNHASVGINSGSQAVFVIYRNATPISFNDILQGGIIQIAPGCLNFTDIVVAGTYTYTITAQAAVNGSAIFNYSVMMVREM